MIAVLILVVKYGFVAVLIGEIVLVARALVQLARPVALPAEALPEEAP